MGRSRLWGGGNEAYTNEGIWLLRRKIQNYEYTITHNLGNMLQGALEGASVDDCPEA